jgi:YkoY family integral membrane protein
MNSFLEFFTLENVFTIFYLAMLEAVLSVDNALALAALVHGRLKDPTDQKHALRYGIVGAYLFRTLVIFGGVWLLGHEWVRWIAALYLVQMSVRELFFKKDGDEEEAKSGPKFPYLSPVWATVIAVEVMDVIFSIDSIAVTLTVSQSVAVLVGGAVLGIATMRFAAQQMIKLIDKFPILEKTAFVLVGIAGLKIVANLLGYDVPEIVFAPAMFGIVGASMLLNKAKPEWFEETEDKKAA